MTQASSSSSKKISPRVTKFAGRMRQLHTDKDARRVWLENDSLRNPFRFAACHWGQLKLLYTEIEFLTLAAESHDLSQCTLVYAGAAPGHSIALLRRLFPTVKFILVDPAPFYAKPDSHVKILNTFFTDETVSTIVADNAKDGEGRTLLFVSDIRLTVDGDDEFEDAVFADMLSQQKWLVNMNAAMGMLKFRLPFTDAKTLARDMRYDYKTQLKSVDKTTRISLRKGTPADPSSVPKGTMVYLDGEIRLQLYPPPDSAETRLIVRQAPNGKYFMKGYDYISYEETMSHFNTVTRRARYSFAHNTVLANNIACFDGTSYEGACEAWIVSEYIRVMIKSSKTVKSLDSSKEVARVIFAIHRDMWEYTKRSVVSCKFGTPLERAKQQGMGRALSKLLKHGQGSKSSDSLESLTGLRRALDTMAKSCLSQAHAQIDAFTLVASRTPAQVLANPLILRRVDYLAQINWLRSEISEIQRLHAVYSDILSNLQPGRTGQGQRQGQGQWRRQRK